MKIKLIITGSTGMVGEAVLMECLNHPDVESVLAVNRRPCGVTDPKLSEIISDNFNDLSPFEDRLSGFNACFFCSGVSSLGKKEPEYFSLTYTLTISFAKTLAKLNPEMTFCYISGAGTDSSEKGKLMWARIKGKTENDLMKLPFSKVFAFRPGFLLASEGQKRVNKYYLLFNFFYPLLRLTMPKYVSTLKELGLAMINSVTKGYEKQVLEVPDIVRLSE